MGRWFAATLVAYAAVIAYTAILGALAGAAQAGTPLGAAAGAAGGALAGAGAGLLLAPFYGITVATAANGAMRPGSGSARWIAAAAATCAKGALLAGATSVAFGLVALLNGWAFASGCIAGTLIAAFCALASCVGDSRTPVADELPRLR